MVKLGALLGLGACLGCLTNAGARMHMSRVSVHDDPLRLTGHMHLDHIADKGIIYIIDLDYADGPGRSGCKDYTQKIPQIMYRGSLTPEGFCMYRGQLSMLEKWPWTYKYIYVCITEFYRPIIREYDSSHRFELWFTEAKPSQEDEDDVHRLRRTLSVSGASRTQYCLTPGDDASNICYCDDPAIDGSLSVVTVDGQYPSKGDSAANFFRHISVTSATPGVLYVIDLDYDDHTGGGCNRDTPPQGRLMAAVLDVGKAPDSCAEGLTKVELANGQGGCMMSVFRYMAPAVPKGNIMHEWKIWLTGDRIYSEEWVVGNLIRGLDAQKAPSVSLCFGEVESHAHRGPCWCQTGVAAPQVFMGSPRITDSAAELAEHIRFDEATTPKQGSIAIFDLDYSDKSWMAGCGSDSDQKSIRLVLSIELSVAASACPDDSITLGDKVPACLKDVYHPVMHPGELEHRFEVWYTRESSTHYPLAHPLAMLDALRDAANAEPPVASFERYCLAYGHGSVPCDCRAPPKLSSGKPVLTQIHGKYPAKGDDAFKFCRHLSIDGEDGGVMYVIDTHHDDVWGDGGCVAESPPTGKILAILTDVGHPASCPDTATKIDLANGLGGCLERSVAFTPLAVPEGDVMHEVKVYLSGRRFGSAESSASKLMDVLEEEHISSVSLCFTEADQFSTIGSCLCQSKSGTTAISTSDKLTIGRVPYSYDALQIMQQITVDPAPSKGRFYIIDRDHDEGPQHSGCQGSSPTRRPKTILTAIIGGNTRFCTFGHTEFTGIQQGKSIKVPICVEHFSAPFLRPGDASHRLEVYYTTTLWSEADEKKGEWFRYKLESLRGLSTQYCLTYGKETNQCDCDNPPRVQLGHVNVVKIDDEYPAYWVGAREFLQHLTFSGGTAGVLYVVDLHFHETRGKGGCDRPSKPPGRIMTVLTHIGHPGSCPEGSTKEWVGKDGMLGCTADKFPWNSPVIRAGDIMHELRIYLSPYRFLRSETSAELLLEDLEEEGVPPVASLCYAETETFSYMGPCRCHATKNAPQVLVSKVTVEDSMTQLANRISFDRTPGSGVIYIIDLDWDASWYRMGCGWLAQGQSPRVALEIQLGVTACSDGERATLWDSQISVCLRDFNAPVLFPRQTSRRFEVWYSSDSDVKKKFDSTLKLRSAFQELMTQKDQRISTTTYCLTYGEDDNQLCNCIPAGNARVRKQGIPPKFPAPGISANAFFSSVVHSLGMGSVMYVIDVHHDKSLQEAAECEVEKNPRGKLISILTHVYINYREKSCPLFSTKIQLAMGLTACLKDNPGYSTPEVPDGDIVHEWRIYTLGYELPPATVSSASTLIEALEARKASYFSLCIGENGQETTKGPCDCRIAL